MCIARESCATTDYGAEPFYAERIQPTLWSLGNEPDVLLPDAVSSWSMRPQEYARFWAQTAPAILARQPDAKLIVGGLVAGQPWWASGIKPLLDPLPWAWDAHPYGKDATEAAALLQAYKEATGGDRWCVLEWDRPAEEIGEYLAMLHQTTEYDAQFCWSDAMVEPFGLIDIDGNPGEYYSYQAALLRSDGDLNENIRKTMDEFEAAGGTTRHDHASTTPTGQIASTDAGLFIYTRACPARRSPTRRPKPSGRRPRSRLDRLAGCASGRSGSVVIALRPLIAGALQGCDSVPEPERGRVSQYGIDLDRAVHQYVQLRHGLGERHLEPNVWPGVPANVNAQRQH